MTIFALFYASPESHPLEIDIPAASTFMYNRDGCDPNKNSSKNETK